jgi:hypothetical protein
MDDETGILPQEEDLISELSLLGDETIDDDEVQILVAES